MGAHFNLSYQSAVCSSVNAVVAFACIINALSVVDTCGNIYHDIFCDFFSRFTAARGTGYNLRYLSERRSLRLLNLSRTVTVRTNFKRRAALRARSFAIGTVFYTLYGNRLFATESRFFKRKRYSYQNILSASR